MALKKVKGTLERVLDKNLQDLVRGIRNHKENESKYIAECMDEIKQELKQENLAIKANAVNKLAYLQMLGYDISWAAFNIIEVMSSTKFTFKRVGYLAASQCFHDGTDVLMLTTNMIRKDMSSVNMYDAGVSLSGLSCFITSDLARDLANDIMTLMSSSKPYLRKKAVLIMYKVFLQFPEALRPAFPRLKEKLEDPDPGVQSAAVNVICELARKNPKNYLSLAPLFFKLMTTSTNNWVLIKIIKLFGALTPLEPRLGKKLIEPLTNLIHSTSAMSLLYECINTVIAVLVSISSGIPNHSASIQLCVQKLRILIEDSDQNLKYLGLLAMSRILASHPKSVQGHKDLVLQCLDDKDESIRLRALDLLYGMVTKKNLMEIVKKLMVHMDKAEGSHYRDELLSKIIVICSQSNYQFVTNFEWYVSILVELTRMEGTRHGGLIAAQMLDVAIRVQAIRHFAVSQMAILLENSHLLANNSQRNGICEVLYAAAWICGEFSEHLKEPQQTLEAMLRPKLTSLPGHIQSVFVQNLLKLYCKVVRRLEDEQDQDTIQQVHTTVQEKLPVFVQSGDLEVQERACSMLALVKYVIKIRDKGVSVGDELASLYAGELNPVAAKAQRKVPVPEGLDLDAWINQPESDSSDEETMGVGFFSTVGSDEHRATYQLETSKPMPELTPEELEKRREARRSEQEHNPHYLKDDGRGKKSRRGDNDVSGIPVAAIDLSVPLHVPGLSSSDKYMQLESQKVEGKRHKEGKSRKKGKKKRRKEKSESEEDLEQIHAVSTVLDAPDGAEGHSDKEEDGDNKDPYKMLDINLDAPLRDDETLPVRTHRIVLDEPKAEKGEEAGALAGEKHKKKHKKDKERKEKKEKKSKKKKRSKSESHEENGPSLLLATGGEEAGEEDVAAVNDTVDTPQENQVQTEEAGDDLEFWLADSTGEKGAGVSANGGMERGDASAVGAAAPIPTITTPKVSATEVVLTSDEEDHSPEEKHKKKRRSKKEKDRKEKKEKKKKSKEKRSEYIEAEGITTPSKENLPPSQQPTPMEVKLPPMSSYKLLADNTSMKLTYEVRINHQRSNQVVVSIVFANLTSHTLKDLEFNVLDTLNTKLIRGLGQSNNDAVKVPFSLPPGAQNEGQFAFTVDDITAPQKMRGTLTYILKSSDGSTQEKVDFRILLPCCSYLLTSPCKSEDFASLLGSGDLTAKGSVKVEVEGASFPHLLARLSFFTHFRVVEQVAESASLFSRSIQDHPICLLVKMSNGALAVDGKSTDSSFLSNILEDVRTVCLETVSAQS
ncbi:AP-3 complex subunit delta-1 [Nucella lapillus]